MLAKLPSGDVYEYKANHYGEGKDLLNYVETVEMCKTGYVEIKHGLKNCHK